MNTQFSTRNRIRVMLWKLRASPLYMLNFCVLRCPHVQEWDPIKFAKDLMKLNKLFLLTLIVSIT